MRLPVATGICSHMTNWIAEMFQQGGPSMFSIANLAAPALLVALLHALRPRRWSAWTAAGLAALALGIGVMGWRESRSRSESFLEREARDPESRYTAADRVAMGERGNLEASRPLQFGGAVAGVCALPLLIGEVRRRRVRIARS